MKLVENVKSYGGEVLIFSSMHESGQRQSSPIQSDGKSEFLMNKGKSELNQLTGIAAILNFPLDIEDVNEQDAEEAEELRLKLAAAGLKE